MRSNIRFSLLMYQRWISLDVFLWQASSWGTDC